ncbi:MAG: 5'/3'-nucleotidase SurE [Dehalococcoidia bacterium]|nr:5'/3'-nucleotidase SurE [Dehalococcoidia bacterium]
MRILISNDDGAFNPALWAMVEAIKDLGDVIVSAPDRDRSGVGAGLTLNDPLRAKLINSPVSGVEAWGVEGTPGDAVILGLKQLSTEPVDLVLCGMNPGNNVGADLTVSGTIGAALQGYLNGVATAAISVALLADADDPVIGAAVHDLAKSMLDHVATLGLDEPKPFVNVNFPKVSDGPYKGAMVAAPSKRTPGASDEVETEVRGVRTIYWIKRPPSALNAASQSDPDTDVWAMRNSWVSLTPLDGGLTTISPKGFANEAVKALNRSVMDNASQQTEQSAG